MLDLLAADDRTLLDRHGRWYIADRDPRWLRRNALVVLGNTADGDDPASSPRSPATAPSDDPILAEHARWASGRLGLLGRPPTGPPGVKHLLVTNDFPPKIGGIQSLLWEWWRRLPPDRFAVLTSPYDGSAQFDSAQAFRIERTREPVLLPHPWMVRRIDDLAREVGADLVVLDPALPLGLVGPSLQLPYDVVLHGAEVTVPGRLPGTKQALGNVLRRARHVVSAGEYAAARGRAGRRAVAAGHRRAAGRRRRAVPAVDARPSARRPAPRFGLPVDAELIVSISRLVPRKGFDVAIEAAALLAPSRPDLVLAISGGGRDERRLRRLAAERGAPVVFLGRVPNDQLPGLYGCADVFAMVCRIALGRPRAGGLRHRVRRGGGVRRAPGRRRLRRRRRGRGRRRHRHRRAPARRRPTRSRRRSRRCSTTTPGGPRWPTASRARAVAEFSYDVLAERLGTLARCLVTMSPSRDQRPVTADAVDVLVLVPTSSARRCSRRRRRWPPAFFTTFWQWVGAITALALFAVGVFAFLWSYWNAVQRSRRDEIGVAQLYLLLGPPTPPRVRRMMLGAARGPVRHRRWSRRSPGSTGPTASPDRRWRSGSSCRCSGSG